MSNACAGPVGAVYDFYIQRPWLVGALWGIDVRPMFADMERLAEVDTPVTVVDVPCGGGLALRGLRPGSPVRFIAVDLDEDMLERTRRRATAAGLEVEALKADMRALPLGDASADLALSYSGLHMINDPQAAIAELARILRPGGSVRGTAFTTQGGRRQRALLAAGARQGHAVPQGTAADLGDWLRAAGFVDVRVEGRGFALFEATRPS